MQDNTIRLRHSRLSIGEIEILFNMLRNPFDVIEEAVEDNDLTNVSSVAMELPIAYGKNSFKMFGMERWENIKEVLKNLKYRRGKKDVKLSLKFNGSPAVVFSVNTDDNKAFGKALETIEYFMDIILFQIDSRRLPHDVREVSYVFNIEDFRWFPVKATSKDAEYSYVKEEWVLQNQ